MGGCSEMNLIRRFVIRAAQALAQDPEARAKASKLFEEDIKPRATDAWKKAQPEIENAKRGIELFVQKVRRAYRKGRDPKSG